MSEVGALRWRTIVSRLGVRLRRFDAHRHRRLGVRRHRAHAGGLRQRRTCSCRPRRQGWPRLAAPGRLCSFASGHPRQSLLLFGDHGRMRRVVECHAPAEVWGGPGADAPGVVHPEAAVKRALLSPHAGGRVGRGCLGSELAVGHALTQRESVGGAEETKDRHPGDVITGPFFVVSLEHSLPLRPNDEQSPNRNPRRREVLRWSSPRPWSWWCRAPWWSSSPHRLRGRWLWCPPWRSSRAPTPLNPRQPADHGPW